MSLPETSTSDLRRMGITPEAIKDEVDRRGGKVDGDIVGYFLPPDGYLGESKNHRARNNIKRDWRSIRTTPPETIKVEDYNQSFQNFDGDDPIEFHFSHTVQVTTAEDYTQTQRFEVSVNANIPGGALVGFNAAMSSEDVKHKSKSVTDSREITFPLNVPAGEGRLVAQKTTVKSSTTLFESALEAEGSAGIEVDPAWWKPNVYWWFYYIENVFPGAEATSRIALSSTNTDVDTKIIKMPHPGNATQLSDIEDAHFFSTDIAVHEPSQITKKGLSLEHICVGISPTQKDRPAGIPSPISATMTVAIRFNDTAPSVPFERRMRILDTLQALILINVSSTGAFGAVLTTPRLASASFTVGYTKDINQPELEEAIIKQAHNIQWGGQYTISFS